MSERRPFAEDIPELTWAHNTPDRCTVVWRCKLPGGFTVTTNDAQGETVYAALVRAGIRIGLERAKKAGRKTPKQVKRYRAKLMLQRRWWMATKRALRKVMLQRDAAMGEVQNGE